MNETNKTKGGLIKFGEYEWRVLDEKDGLTLIITERVIEQRVYHGVQEPITWEKSDMRKYLNGEFLCKFTASERAKIAETHVTDRDNPWYGAKWGNATDDRVFLLSYDEVVRYFGDSGAIEDRRGEEAGVGLPFGGMISDDYNDARRVFDLNGDEAWAWLRSPGGPRDHTDYDHVTNGSVGDVIFLCGDDISKDDGGIRPAMWVQL